MIFLQTFNVLISILSAFSGTLHFSSFSSGSRWNPLAASASCQPSPKEHRQVVSGGLCGQTVTRVIVQHGGIEVWVVNVIGFWEKGDVVYNSPELKAQVGFSDHLSSVRLSVCPSVNFLHFRLLQNQWANINQTWHKASLDKEDSSLFKQRVTPFTKGR